MVKAIGRGGGEEHMSDMIQYEVDALETGGYTYDSVMKEGGRDYQRGRMGVVA